MTIQTTLKKATVAVAAAALFLGVGTTQTYAKHASQNYQDYGFSHITRYDMLKVAKQQGSSQFEVPAFNSSTVKNLDSVAGLDVWDSWPLQNADGTTANYHGYHVVFALAGAPNDGNDTTIYLFYQKIGDNSIDSWKSAGRVFKNSDKNVPNDPYLSHQTQEWSGSATLTNDGKVRLFYTDFSGAPEVGGTGDSNQVLTTAQINVSQVGQDNLKVDGIQDYKSIFDGGDGTIYQNIQQFHDEGLFGSGDNHTLRDPHYVEDNGHKYLVFESNTGTETGYQGDDQFDNPAYYGGSYEFYKIEKESLLNSSKKQLASLANGALGIIELNNDFTLKKVLKPLIASNTVTDEIERANVFKMNGKWYLFTDSRGAKMTINGIADKDIYMLGFVSNSLTGPYKPLNKSGLVLHTDLDPQDLTFTYSHFAVPQNKGNKVVITSYMTNRGFFTDHQSTFAPSFLLSIDGSNTSVVKNSILEQGQLTIGKH
ncbi:glycoside hydrolase family 68 protein [Sporolactobacillus sp. STSJ-5]|uniref:glycoside hydrolase family 68 protein n=1 Tax=Sporolactobacillus sp. STSJ-5 TaxID=2965076 RepID=UPI002105A835|nr:glycoside hydrolase family 68 protein [Sporolactobacillus sp. STSJ-5]MCQ2011342.1 glycoside hydrolase family 68 protein [Sporolactobacillus sp. STSJ-5]